MALNEACQLWIEQEIDEGLGEGKTPDLISKEVSQAVAMLFETVVKEATIKKRAQRRKGQMSPPVGRPTKLTETRKNPPTRGGGERRDKAKLLLHGQEDQEDQGVLV